MVTRRAGGAALAVAMTLTILGAQLALAVQSESGTKNCGSLLGYTHAVYNDVLTVLPPGSAHITNYVPDDGLWHTQETYGAYGGGDWTAIALPYLNFNLTYAGCRSA